MKFFLLFISLSALADSDPLFTTVTYYEALGDKFRVETVSKWPKCVENKRARKIILDKTNELRELAYWDEDNKIHEAGKNNNFHVHKKVQEIFAKSQIQGNPCLMKDKTKESDSAKGSLQ